MGIPLLVIWKKASTLAFLVSPPIRSMPLPASWVEYMMVGTRGDW